MCSTATATNYDKLPPYKLYLNMDSVTGKEERKREYNRLAQREFRRRRKEHLKSLEQAQKELSTERAEEIDRLRYQNDELRRENNTLRAQIYGSSSTAGQLLSPTSILDNRQYSLSPSTSGATMSGTGSPNSTLVGTDFIPIGGISSSIMGNSLHAYTDRNLSAQPYSMVHYPAIRHNTQSSPESSGYRDSLTSMDHPAQSVKVEGQVALPAGPVQSQINNLPALMKATPYDRNRARIELAQLFRPIISDPSIRIDPEKHLLTLRSMAHILPSSLKPTKLQLECAHYYGIDMIASHHLRDRLISLNSEVARQFVEELGVHSKECDYPSPLTIWGEEPLNEMYWELSKDFLERWGWLLGSEWVQRANFWRKRRGSVQIPEW